MKAKLMALLMAVGLGVTGVAATVQAAGARAEEPPHVHNIIRSEYRREYASDYNQTYHAWYTVWHHVCDGCKGYDVDVLERLEAHDYENFYDNKGNMIYSYCTVCDVEIVY